MSPTSASRTASLMPRSRTVSSMPGIDSTAPLRTLTRSGRGPRPKLRSHSASSQVIACRTASQMVSSVCCGSAKWRRQTSVVIQNAGGTGSPLRRMTLIP